jgi:peptidoglycan-associated lipoprotein
MKKVMTVASFLIVSLVGATGCSHNVVKSEQEVPKLQAKAIQDPNLEMAHFAFNSAELTDFGKETLKNNAQQLKQNPQLRVQIQGFCDDRGGVQYNLALGERRAKAAKAYLQKLGIAGDRIAAVSFGKADPLDAHENEQAWAKNRRANFVIENKTGKSFQ